MALTMKARDVLNGNVEEVQQAASSYLEAEDHLRKKARLSLDGHHRRSPVSISDILAAGGTSSSESVASSGSGTDEPKSCSSTQVKSGRWSLDEKLMFLYGLSLFGKGRWKKIHAYVPERSLVQIKSHAQKVLNRVDAGENVFLRLQDNRERLKVLVDEANRRIEAKQEAQTPQVPKKKRKRTSTRKPAPVTVPAFASPWEMIHGHSKHRKSEDAPTVSIPSSPSSSADPPGVHASQQQDDSTETAKGGSGAVIAAVAALCQLSARTDP